MKETSLIFREDSIDKRIYESVFKKNEYKIPTLENTDVVVDVGAHIGSFSLKCWFEGSRNIFAFEANKENYNVCFHNCSKFGINVSNNAVRGNKDYLTLNCKPSKDFPRTKAENLINYGGLVVSTGEDIKVVTLEEILHTVGGKIDILKLDCEGSEFPIIYQSNPRIFQSINKIVGEYHSGSLRINFCEGKNNTSEELEKYLQNLGYKTKFIPCSPASSLGHFFCEK